MGFANRTSGATAMTKTTMGARLGKTFGGVLLIGAAAILLLGWRAPIEAAMAADRQALWHVVRACVTSHGLTGAAFPCLAVHEGSGENEGYIVLRPPVGPPDTILAPTRKIVGIEDPWLQSGEAPNYFEDAWNARGLANALGDDRAALAVNSRFVRGQDQLHIHIGCMFPGVRERLAAAAPRLPVGEWTRVASILPGADPWVYRTASADMAKIAPFRLIASKLTASADERAGVTMVVAPLAIAGRNEIVVLAARVDPADHQTWIAAEDVVNARCPKVSKAVP